jgi:hypothetical protein
MADNDMMANVRGGALVGAGFGGMIGAVIGWIMGASMVAVPVIGPVVGQGVLSTALVALVAGAAGGALIGALAGVFSQGSSVVSATVQAASAPVTAPLSPISPVQEGELEGENVVFPASGTDIAPVITVAQPEAAVPRGDEAEQGDAVAGAEEEEGAVEKQPGPGTPVLRVRRRIVDRKSSDV